MAVAISVEHVSKRFRLYHEKYMTLKERVIHFGNLPYEELLALDDVCMEIHEGESIGLLGHNGSGKSTLLKCMAGVLRPTKGQIQLRGQLSAVIELGAGFNPELSGRDNIYLNATLLGMPKREIDRRFDAIVEYSELERFIDSQVKFYSSGMFAKLGFAVAVSFDPDVLLIDEVFAVGDERFQRKCLDKIRQFKHEGKTIVIVSHAADLLRVICDRAYVLERGREIGNGEIAEAVRLFREHLFGLTGENRDGSQAPGVQLAHAVRLGQANVDHPNRASRTYLLPGEPLTVTLPYEADSPVQAVFSISIYNTDHQLVYATDTEAAGYGVADVQGAGSVRWHFDAIPLLDGTYTVSFGVTAPSGSPVYDLQEQEAHFEVMNPRRDGGMVALPARVEVLPGVAGAVHGVTW